MQNSWYSVSDVISRQSSRSSSVSQVSQASGTRGNSKSALSGASTTAPTNSNVSIKSASITGQSGSNPLRNLASHIINKSSTKAPKSRSSSPEPSFFSRKRYSKKKNNGLISEPIEADSTKVEEIDFETFHNHNLDDISSCSSLGWDADEYEPKNEAEKLLQHQQDTQSLTDLSQLSIQDFDTSLSTTDVTKPTDDTADSNNAFDTDLGLGLGSGFKDFSFSMEREKSCEPEKPEDPLSESKTTPSVSNRTSMISADDGSIQTTSSIFRKESKASAFSIQTKSSATDCNLDKVSSTTPSLHGTKSLSASRRVSLVPSVQSTDTKETKEAHQQTQQEIWQKFLQFSQRSRASDPIVYARIRKEAWMQYNDPHSQGSSHNKKRSDKDVFELWLVQAMRLLYDNRLVFSRPAIDKIYGKGSSDSTTTVLEVQGAMQDFWGWQLAIDHPDSTIYGFKFYSSDDITSTGVSYEGPLNYMPFVGHSLKKLPFEDDFFDVVSAKGLWYYMKASDWVPTLQELKRVMKPGGVLEISMHDFGLLNDTFNIPAWQSVKKGLQSAKIDTEPLDNFLDYAAKAGFEECHRALVALPKGWAGHMSHVTDFIFSYLFDTGIANLANQLPSENYRRDLNMIRKTVLSNSSSGSITDSFVSGLISLHYLTKPLADSEDIEVAATVRNSDTGKSDDTSEENESIVQKRATTSGKNENDNDSVVAEHNDAPSQDQYKDQSINGTAEVTGKQSTP